MTSDTYNNAILVALAESATGKDEPFYNTTSLGRCMQLEMPHKVANS
jgi:hypothetical protein